MAGNCPRYLSAWSISACCSEGDARRLELVHADGCGAPLATHVQCAEGHTVQFTQAEARIRPKQKR